MQTLAKDDSTDMSAPRAALLKRLEEVATKLTPRCQASPSPSSNKKTAAS